MSSSHIPNLADIPVGGEVDREVIFAADSPRDLTLVEVMAIAVLEAWGDEPLGCYRASWEVVGEMDNQTYSDVMYLVDSAYEYLAANALLGGCVVRRRLEAAQLIREGSVRGAS